MKRGIEPLRLARGVALVVGTMDFLTGLGLVLLPGMTLALMRVEIPPAGALVFVRWIGVFVGMVGAGYLWALLRGGVARLILMLEFTLLFRTAVGIFVLVAWQRDWLPTPWLSVAATDLMVAGLQAWIIGRINSRF